MRVVNSPRLWDNKVQKKHHRAAFGFFAVTFFVGLIAFGGVTDFRIHAKPQQFAESIKITSPSVLGNKTTDVQSSVQFLPEQNDFADLLLQKLSTPPPPPVADCAATPCIALTFDDGPNTSSTGKILDTLDHENVKATFFLVGSRIGTNPAFVQRMNSEGYGIGNHSWSHADFTRLNAAQIQQQIDLTQNAIVALGVPAPTMFRPPYGARNALVRQNIHMPIIMWNVDPKDWGQNDPARIIQIVESQAKPGAIILMHDRDATAAAIPKIVEDLKKQYRLVTVQQLLNLAPDTQGEFIGR